jgi:1,4-dihydroxy-2-naphthoyl-CoA hydrolase
MTDPLEGYRALESRGVTDTFGIEIRELTAERVVATMPVDHRTRQPFGLLHGGASVALAETVASLGAWTVGVEINANHLRAKRDGIVTAVATPVHRGGMMQVWSIEIRDEQERLVCISRCTLAMVDKDRIPG